MSRRAATTGAGAADTIVASLYDGILESAQWAYGLQAIQARLQCAAFHHLDIACADKSARSVAVSLQGTAPPSDTLVEYERHYVPQDIRFPAMWAMQEGGVWWDQEHFGASTFRRAPIYAEFLASLGMRHTVCIPLRDGAASRDFVGFIRHLDQEPFGADEQALVAQLAPHLVRANKLRHGTARLAAQAALGTAALGALPQALAVVDAALRPCYLNSAAEQALAHPRAGGLALRHGAFRAADPATHNHLAHSVAAACGPQGGASIVRVEATANGQAAVQVLPLQARHPLARTLRGRPHALLVWMPPTALLQRAAHVALALGLTDTEARLALLLAQGRTVKDFAQIQGCTWHTARTHAKNLLRKTGCQRQADVVLLVRSLTGA